MLTNMAENIIDSYDGNFKNNMFNEDESQSYVIDEDALDEQKLKQDTSNFMDAKRTDTQNIVDKAHEMDLQYDNGNKSGETNYIPANSTNINTNASLASPAICDRGRYESVIWLICYCCGVINNINIKCIAKNIKKLYELVANSGCFLFLLICAYQCKLAAAATSNYDLEKDCVRKIYPCDFLYCNTPEDIRILDENLINWKECCYNESTKGSCTLYTRKPEYMNRTCPSIYHKNKTQAKDSIRECKQPETTPRDEISASTRNNGPSSTQTKENVGFVVPVTLVCLIVFPVLFTCAVGLKNRQRKKLNIEMSA